MNTKCILFVDDEKNVLSSIERNLLREPYRRIFAGSAAEALDIMTREKITVIVSDIRMPGMNGLELLEKVRQLYPDTVRMVLSGTAESEFVLKAINSGEVYRYLKKPLNEVVELCTTIRQAIEYHDLLMMQKDLISELAAKNAELSEWQNRMAHELNIAGLFQLRLMSAEPVTGRNYSVKAAYKPCFSVGGDFFDVISLPDGRLCVYVADVAGHGVASAFISTLLRLTTTDLVKKYVDKGPAFICRKLAAYMHEHGISVDSFTTLFIAVLDADGCSWRAFRCGHPPPIVCRKDGSIKAGCISEEGVLPLGFFDDPGQYEQELEITWKSEPGDSICLFTDGLYEARYGDYDNLFGLDRLAELFGRLVSASSDLPEPSELIAQINAAGYNTDGDDCCAIVVRLGKDS